MIRKYGLTLAIVLSLGLLTVLLTASRFGGDQDDYAGRVAAVMTGRAPGSTLVEPGHLLWMPMLFVVSRATSAVDPQLGMSAEERVLQVGRAIAASAAILGAVAIASLALSLFGSVRVAVVAGVLMMTVHGVLNYAQAGDSYVPGLAAACGALALGATRSRVAAAAAGFLAALAVLLWLPFVLILPALFYAPWLLKRDQGAATRADLVRVVATCALTGALAYGYAVSFAHVPVTGIPAWIHGANHGIAGSGGVPRTVLGLVRSFVFVGDDPLVVRRFLGGDPFYPVTLNQLVSLPIWARLVLFLGASAGIVAIAARSNRVRFVVFLLATAAIPCLVLGLYWQGGDIERYIPIYPFAILCTCAALVSAKPDAIRAIVVASVAALVVNNVYALARPVVSAEDAAVAGRVKCGGIVRPGSLLIVPNWHDPIVNVFRTAASPPGFPPATKVAAAVTPMSPEADHWREWVARQITAENSSGHQVWIAKRALAARPALSSKWVEGEDERLHWADIPQFFTSLSTRDVCGTPDGFVLLTPDQRTKHVLEAFDPPSLGNLPNP